MRLGLVRVQPETVAPPVLEKESVCKLGLRRLSDGRLARSFWDPEPSGRRL